jgi:predicted hotdog family 3-hydroxylacyl-ACP dehydratase
MAEFPIKVEILREYLPHRDPMVWIDQVNWVDNESGEAQVRVNSSRLYWNWEAGSLLSTAPIEWMAQTVGFCRAARIHSGGLRNASKLGRAFLVGLRDVEVQDLDIVSKDTIVVIRVHLIRELEPLSLVRGEVFIRDKPEKLISRATLKLYGE